VSNPPRYLGAPIAPRHLASGKKWKAYLPYSSALDSCSVVFKAKHHPRKKVACNSTSMPYGGAVVTWNGRDHAGHRIKAGTVTWTAHVSNADGDARDASGADRDVTGKITVKH
jgi:hypothetical protein